MLVQVYSKLKENLFIKAIRKIMDSYWMMLAIIALAAISNLFGVEIFVYYCYTLFIILAALFCDDLLSVIPIACCGYMTFARNNNPMSKEQTSIFLENSTMTHMLIIGVTIAIFAISRIIFDIVKHKERRQKPKLLYGFLALGLAYVIGGLFSGSYNFKTAFFGLVEILALSFSYFCFYYTVDWKKVSKNYFPLLFMLIGCLMIVEIFNMQIEAGLFQTNGEFSRSHLFTGWGTYNNVASICIFCIPAPFYFACTKKNGWIYSLIATIFLLFMILTQSRNGMLIGTITYAIGAIFVLFKTKGKERLKHIITFSLILLLAISTLFIFEDLVNNIFASVYDVGTSDNGRINIYKRGIEQFLESPIFGKGFYECEAFRWGIDYTPSDFLPPRYHDTYIQILASCGIVGIIAYIYHRFETIKLFLKNKNTGNSIVFISLIGFILISVFDCHFHNFGPGFLYSSLLLFAEKLYTNN